MAYNNRGAAYYDIGKYELAVSDYTKSLEIDPTDDMAYNNRGNAYVAIGKEKQAISDYTNAIESAEQELGWTLPISDSYQQLWIKNRSKRYLFFFLLTESAHKFKFEQINLQHRFDHYKELIKSMDEEFQKELEARPEKFSNVSATHLFGTQINAGFKNDALGRDATYDSDVTVDFFPKETD